MNSSDSDEDNAILYGTPLEPYEEDEIPSKRKYQQPTDQYAVDAHGRRRFHGAFTGGFSAGFGNTVGSQEGWTPATFKSSRSERPQSSSQRPEDFMDEEDRSEFGIAPKYMQTHSEFSGQKRTRQTFHDGSIPGEPVLDQLIRAVHETVAVRMLRDMGWRPGQGTGDRVSRREKRKAKERQKVYGCYMPEELRPNSQSEEKSDHSSDSEFEYDTLFAPDDYEPYILNRKSDRFGLGYQGLSRHSVLGNLVGEYGETSSRSHLKMKDKGKKVSIRGQAFGVGAFEMDDEDIYAAQDMSHYDFAIGGPDQDKLKMKPAKEQSKNVLQGFVRACAPLPPVPSHPPPVLPRDYAPAAAGARRTRFSAIDAPQRDQGLGRHELTADARGALLGEPPKQTDAKQAKEDLIAKIVGRNVNFVTTTTENQNTNNDSIDLTSPNKILFPSSNDITSPNDRLPASSDSLTSSNNRKVEKIIDLTKPNTDTPDFISIKDSGKELVNVFKPFASNPLKQRRYETYLKDKDSLVERDGEADRLSEWEREREFMEFEQAAKLYRPLTGIMGDRFTHATEPDDATNPLTAVSKSNINYGLATKEQIEAAKSGMYGIMTRTKTSWRPESIVCKRFNVPEPGGVRLDPKKDDKPKVSYSIFSYLESSVHDKDSFAKEQTKFSGSKSLRDVPKTVPKPTENVVNTNQTDNNTVKNTEQSIVESNQGFKRMTVAELFLKESEKTKEKGQQVIETIDQFDKMDLYKSIFLSDSEEEVDKELSNENEPFNIIDDFLEAPKNVQRNTSPPRGIFANINFDELNSWRRNIDVKKPESGKEASTDKPSASVAKETNQNMQVDEIYGPKIPETLQKRLESNDSTTKDNEKTDLKESSKNDKNVVEIDSSSSDSWVDVKKVKDKKKKKKSKHKKEKSKHKKSKHKKKDKR